jgi:hypothetical protein
VTGVTRPISGEEVCGDTWAARLDETDPDAQGGPGAADPAILLMLCDGLGHGPLAAAAATRAKAAFRRSTRPGSEPTGGAREHRVWWGPGRDGPRRDGRLTKPLTTPSAHRAAGQR